jgi:uncharacterized protein YlxW (UPF0749 family)
MLGTETVRHALAFSKLSMPLQLLSFAPQTSLQHSEEDEEERIAANVALLELKQENSRLTERLLQLKARCERLEADKADLNVSLLRR